MHRSFPGEPASAEPNPGDPASDVSVRPARDDIEVDAAGAVVALAYATDELAGADYRAVVRDATARARDAVLLVAVDPAGDVVGSVTYARAGTPYAQICADSGAEFRMLGVSPAARGRGVGAALVQACVALAREDGASELALSTSDPMQAAQRLYQRLGFARTPERDWSPVPNFLLTTYRLALPG